MIEHNYLGEFPEFLICWCGLAAVVWLVCLLRQADFWRSAKVVGLVIGIVLGATILLMKSASWLP